MKETANSEQRARIQPCRCGCRRVLDGLFNSFEEDPDGVLLVQFIAHHPAADRTLYELSLMTAKVEDAMESGEGGEF